jgi:hypothetical protein
MPNQNDPSIGQTVEAIEAHYSVCKIGTKAAIRNTHAGMLHFTETEIVSRGTRTVNVKCIPASGGTAFYFNGKNFKFSRGQSTLVIWTQSIADWNKKHPVGLRISRS